MAKGDGQTLERLFIELGLDLSKLQTDILAADKTVTENLGRLNREKNVIKLRMEADIASLDRVKDAAKILEIQEKALNQQLTLQKDRMNILEAAYRQVASNANATAVAVNKAEQAFLREKIAVGQLERQLKALASQKGSPAPTNSLLSGYQKLKGNVAGTINEITSALNGLQGASNSVDGALTTVLGIVGRIPPTAAAATAVLVGIPLIFKGIENSIVDLARASAASGDAVYVMSRGMQMSVVDAAKFSTNAKIAGVQVNDLATAVKNVQRQVARGGEDSRAAEWLRRYGESAYDASGNLKDLNEMTFALSRALKRAQADGKGAEFVLNAFRNVSADAITAIEDWADVNAQAASIVKAGLANPKLAHEVQGNLNAMNVQSAQLGTSFTNALLPVANEIIPRLTERMGKMTLLIRDNKDVILDLGKDFADVWGAVESTIDNVVEGVSVLGKLARQNRVVRQNDTQTVVERYKDDKSVQNSADLLKKEIAAGSYIDEDIARLRSRSDLYQRELKRTEADIKAIWTKRREEFAEANKPIIDKYKYDDSIKSATDLLHKLTDTEKETIEKTTSAFGSMQERTSALYKELQKVREEAKQAQVAVEEFKSVAESFSSAGQERRLIGEDQIEQLRAFRKYQEEADEILYKLSHTDYENKKFGLSKWLQEQLPRDTEQSMAKYKAVIEEYSALDKQIEQERAEKLKEIRERIAAADRTELENKIADIEKEKESWIQAGMEKAEAEGLAQKQLSDYVTNAQKDFNSQMQSLYKTALENRLDQIEKERQAWIDKCGNEVKATQKAEQEKADAQRNAAMNVIKQQAKEYEAFQKGGLAGLQAYKMADLARSGVNLDYLSMTPQQLQQFQQANQLAEKGLMPQFMTEIDKAMYREQWQQSYQQRQKEFDDQNYAITNGKKTTMSEALGGIPITLKLGDDSVLKLSPNGQSATMRDYETDNNGRIQSMTETNFELPSIVSEVAQSFSEMPSIVQVASDSLGDLPTAVQGITENLSSMEIPQFADMNQPLKEVTVRLNDLSSVLESFSSQRQNQSAEQKTPVNVSVTVQIQEAYAWDSEHIQELADRVADEIQPEIISAIGGDSNSY